MKKSINNAIPPFKLSLFQRRPGEGLKQTFLFTIIGMLGLYAQAQEKDWQWIKSGGAIIEDEVERVYDIATDSDRNVYVLSAIGIYGLDVDGHSQPYYGNPLGSVGDYVLASFDCDGSYRWSKIIGGEGNENRPYMVMDDNDNLYIVGRFDTCDEVGPGEYPARIGDDIILDQSSDSCSLMFIAKYNASGNLIWFKRPMDLSDSDIVDEVISKQLAIDPNGTIHWLVSLVPSSYANGAFVNTMTGKNWFIFKYNSQGNFLNAIYMDIQLSSTFLYNTLRMYRNPYNGHFYFTGRRPSGDTAIFGGQPVTGGFYLASFDGQGNFLWVRQGSFNSPVGGSEIYNLDFDAQNNIYLGFKFLGAVGDSFIGFSMDKNLFPGLVMKTNPDATSITWVSYSNTGTAGVGAINLENNVLNFTSWGYGNDFTWGDQTIDINTLGEHSEVLIASFDKETGNCINLDFIPGNPGYTDIGTALATDANGDLLVGGQFEHTLYDTNGGTVSNPNPSNPDFFIAKYATAPCGDLSGMVEMEQTKVKIWPNPVKNTVHFSGTTANSYHLHAINGKLVQKGKIKPTQKTIEIKGLAPGVYLLELKSAEGKQVVKVVKE